MTKILRSQFYTWSVVLLAFTILMTSGCGGCRSGADDDASLTEEEKKKKDEEKKKEQEKPNFETKMPVFLPGEHEESLATNATKMGHWVTANFRVIANKFDSQGELSAYSVGAGQQPNPISDTNYYSVTSRPVSMPKGEWRNLETSVYIPVRDSASATIDFAVNRGLGGLAQVNNMGGTKIMDAYQYHMVVLTNRREANTYLGLIDAVKIPNQDEYGMGPSRPFYYVVRTDPKKFPIQLPRESLNWTTIAYLVWDDLDPDQLDEDQQQAMLDWLHFGGQLILSGPDCLDKLDNSFLADYLPAKFGGALNLTDKEFAEVNKKWSIPISNQPKLKQEIQVSEQSPLLGVKLAMHSDASFVRGTGEIIAERQIGRGRIVATAFSMDDKPMKAWPSYQGFINSCLMRRPARKFRKTPDMSVTFDWSKDGTSIFDPLVGSTVRFLSRDLVDSSSQGTPSSFNPETVRRIRNPNPNNLWYGQQEVVQAVKRDTDDHWHYGGFQHDAKAGVAGWNDNSGISTAARETLKETAGIVPPSSDFVFKVLAVYLLVLVPLNWFIFRMIGRVEWAWIAAPLIAIAGALSVAKMASLDIGFVRSNSQVGVVEIYADYSRAHVAQYSALYTSLSTGYDIDLDNHTAQSLPLGGGATFNKKQSIQPVKLRRTLTNRLEGLQIQSNTTGLLHTEFMLDLGGPFSVVGSGGSSKSKLRNDSTLNINSAAVIRCTGKGVYEFADVGDLNAGTSSPELEFVSANGDLRKPWAENPGLLSNKRRALHYWTDVLQRETEDSSGVRPRVLVEELRGVPEFAERWNDLLAIAIRMKNGFDAGSIGSAELTQTEFETVLNTFDTRTDIDVSRIFDAVIDNLQLAKGEMRLLGVTDQPLGTTKFSPASTQTEQQTLVVAHLKRAKLPNPVPDTNTRRDFSGRSNLDWQDELDELEAEVAGNEEETEDEESTKDSDDDAVDETDEESDDESSDDNQQR